MKKAIKPTRFYDANGKMIGYADATYAFVCQYNDAGERVFTRIAMGKLLSN